MTIKAYKRRSYTFQVDLRGLIRRKKIVIMCGHGCYLDLCDHFEIYTNIKLLGCIPKINIMFYVNYTSINKKVKKE